MSLSDSTNRHALFSNHEARPRSVLYWSLARAIIESALIAWVAFVICAVTQIQALINGNYDYRVRGHKVLSFIRKYLN
jgi:hypothetical protein